MISIILMDVCCFILIAISSSIFNSIKTSSSTLNEILRYMGFVGIIIHELSHYVADILTGIIPEKIHIEFSRFGSWGYVKTHPKSFIQAFISAYAPIIFITWIIIFLFQILFTIHLDFFIQLLILLIIFSAILGAIPSSNDVKYPLWFFQKHPWHSFYQILIGLDSLFITFLLVTTYSISFPHSILYYLIAALVYLLQIWFFRGLYFLIKYYKNKNTLYLQNKSKLKKRKRRKRRNARRAQW